MGKIMVWSGHWMGMLSGVLIYQRVTNSQIYIDHKTNTKISSSFQPDLNAFDIKRNTIITPGA